jgi:hypothetical protein
MTEMTQPASGAETVPTRTLSPIARAVAIFVRPAQAWDGLQDRVQWWFPMLLMVAITIGFSVLLYDRAVVPMMTDRWDDQVQSGAMTSAQADQAAAMMKSPAATAMGAGSQGVIIAIWIAVVALVLWFGVGFVLGTKFKYRQALEVSAWAYLITLPGQLLACGLAWSRQTFKGIHIGLGALLPTSPSPSKLMVGLGLFLDGLGPFAIWYLIVMILGCIALSGAPRKSVVWTVSALYLVLAALGALIGGLFTPGS